MNREIKQLIKTQNRYIFDTMCKYNEDFNKCYICRKEIKNDNFRIITFPNEEGTACLCSKCKRKFDRQAKIHRKIFLENEVADHIKSGEKHIIKLINSQVLKVKYAHKMWLDKQRNLHDKNRN